MLEKLKSFVNDAALFNAGVLIAVAVASFGLGRTSVLEDTQKSVVIQTQTEPVSLQSAAAPVPLVASPVPEVTVGTGDELGSVVASKSGTKYHLPTCSGAKSIKPENLVSFASKEEAEAAGYSPAANCPGLK